MAILHQATITPTKGELVEPWLPTRAWWDGIAERGPVGTFRFDDPAGEVGMECFLFGSAEGSTLFVPLTYRGAPLAGAEEHLLGTMTHSVLGERWVYDGCGDPVFVATLIEAIRNGTGEAELEVHRADGSVVTRERNAHAHGTGGLDLPATDPAGSVDVSDEADRTVVRTGDVVVAVARRVGADLGTGARLVGTFEGGSDLTLAVAAPVVD